VALRKRGVDIAVGDFTSIDDIRAAMEGVKSAYFLYPIAPGIISAGAYFAQAAKEAGVSAIVNMSQISARRESKSHAAQDHWISERVFDWSGVATTHLRPTFFAEWLIYPHFAKEIWTRKKIEFPDVLGAKIEYAPASLDEFRRKMEQVYKFPPFLVQHLVEVAQNYRAGVFAGTNDVVEKITGTPAISIAAFIEKNRKAFA
jgi:NAD(P)H dehydrogenase (quinone)